MSFWAVTGGISLVAAVLAAVFATVLAVADLAYRKKGDLLGWAVGLYFIGMVLGLLGTLLLTY